jgi:CheY-like chemotaxis protein
MNGIWVTRLIRESERTNGDVPIIALAPQVTPETSEIGEEIGLDRYLGKPLRKDEVFAWSASSASGRRCCLS